MEVLVTKIANGALVPLDEEQAVALQTYKTGDVIKVTATKMRNGQFFKKWFVLVKFAYDLAAERMQPKVHKGIEVRPNFDEFRKDITILAGHFEATYKYNGEVKLRAKSLAWANMKEQEFEKLYSDTINVILEKVLPHVPEHEFHRALDITMSYA